MDVLPVPLRIISHPIVGAGRGKRIGVPTINLSLVDIPSHLEKGVYAARVILDPTTDIWHMAAVHYGERPVFHDTLSFEVHLLDITVSALPHTVIVDLVARLRCVQHFDNAADLRSAIAQDIMQTRAILSS